MRMDAALNNKIGVADLYTKALRASSDMMGRSGRTSRDENTCNPATHHRYTGWLSVIA